MRLLVAEDDAPLAEFLRQRLHDEQFSVELAKESGEARRLAGEKPFDLVILDLNANGHDPLDLLRNIRARKPDLPVIMVAPGNAEERVRQLDAGADDSLGKPFPLRSCPPAFAPCFAAAPAPPKPSCASPTSRSTV